MRGKHIFKAAFTLIELSIVLVIIGLIVGGILVGQNLIRASETRAQISQIEKYNTAANTFYGKYGYLPGDITSAQAAAYGFTSRAGVRGRGDGNGAIEGYYYAGPSYYGWAQGGETLLFWTDLTTAGLIDGGFTTTDSGNAASITGTQLGLYLSQAKIGHGDYVYVWSAAGGSSTKGGINYFGISMSTVINTTQNMTSVANLPVIQVYNIDAKIDDGRPLTGKVIANYVTSSSPPVAATNTTTAGGDATSCYDTTTSTYSVTINGGNGGNCALTLQFQ